MISRSVFRVWSRFCYGVLAVLTTGLIWCFGHGDRGLLAMQPPRLDPPKIAQAADGQFLVDYAPLKNPDYAPVRKAIANAQMYESIAAELNKLLQLPTDVTITLSECGVANAFYSPDDKRIVMCDELLEHFAKLFAPTATSEEDLAESMLYTNLFVFFHELGHGLIDLYDLPTTGREEDAVDEFSTVLLLEAGDFGTQAVLRAAHWFALQSEQQQGDLAFWDEHSLDMQRFYGVACLVYGKSPDRFASFVQDGILPESRAERCEREYTKKSQSWEKLLAPHVRT